MICLNTFALAVIVVLIILVTLLIIKLDVSRRNLHTKYQTTILEIKKDKDEEIAGLMNYKSKINQDV